MLCNVDGWMDKTEVKRNDDYSYGQHSTDRYNKKLLGPFVRGKKERKKSCAFVMMLSITCSIGGMFFFSVDYHQQKGNLVILFIMLKWAAAAGN